MPNGAVLKITKKNKKAKPKKRRKKKKNILLKKHGYYSIVYIVMHHYMCLCVWRSLIIISKFKKWLFYFRVLKILSGTQFCFVFFDSWSLKLVLKRIFMQLLLFTDSVDSRIQIFKCNLRSFLKLNSLDNIIILSENNSIFRQIFICKLS